MEEDVYDVDAGMFELELHEQDESKFDNMRMQYEIDEDDLMRLDVAMTGRTPEKTLEMRRKRFAQEQRERVARQRILSTLQSMVTYGKVSHRSFVPTVAYSVLLGGIMGCLGIGSEYAVFYLNWCRSVMLRDLGGSGPWNYWIDFGLWIMSAILLGGTALALGYWSPESTGGGTPEIRAMFSGRLLPKVLSMRLIVAKFFGCILAMAAGMFTGKMGPIANVGVAVAYQLMRLPYFRRFMAETPRKYEMLAAGLSASVGGNLLAPFAGPLWAFEFAYPFSSLRMFWVSFIASASAAITYRFLSFSTTYLVIDFPFNAWRWEDLWLFALLGVICGLFSSVQVMAMEVLQNCRRALSNAGTNSFQKKFFWVLASPYLFGALMVLLTAVVTYPGAYAYMAYGVKPSLQAFWGLDPLGQGSNVSWANPSPLQALALYIASRWILLVLCFSIPMAYGTFAPSMLLGGAIGRFVGEVVLRAGSTNLIEWDEPTKGGAYHYYPAIFAICGSAAYNASIAKMLSVSLFILEMTGALELSIPCMISCIAAFLTQFYLADSFYDMMCRTRGLSWVPPVSDIKKNLPVSFYMTERPDYICLDSRPDEMLEVLKCNVLQRYFPVVDSAKRRHPLGYTTRRDILLHVVAQIEGQSHDERIEKVRHHMHAQEAQDITSMRSPVLRVRSVLFGADEHSGKLHWRRTPILLGLTSPLWLVYHNITRLEQPVVLVVDPGGTLAGMMTREQTVVAIGYRKYFRVLRGMANHLFRLMVEFAATSEHDEFHLLATTTSSSASNAPHEYTV